MSTASDIPDLTGKTFVVTGASSGIGAVAARAFAAAGADVVPIGRSPEASRAIGDELGVEPLVADFAELFAVRNLATQILDRCPRIDVMLHNAGGFATRRIETVDGHERMFQTNYLAPFLLQSLLHERIVATPEARIVVTSSNANLRGEIALDDLDWRRRRFRPLRAYGSSKLGNILFTKELSRRLQGTGITATTVHPGVVATRLVRESRLASLITATPVRHLMSVSPQEGAAPLIHLATWPDPAFADGRYFDRMSVDGKTSGQADDPALARTLWARTEEILGEFLG